MTEKPKPRTVNSTAQQQLSEAAEQFDAFDNQIKEMTMDRMSTAPKQEVEQQTKLSSNEIEKSKNTYLKPERSISSKEKFNENYREEYNQGKEYVNFIAENKEIIGEVIEMWTKPFPGIPAEFWKIPVNTPIWAPRYVAEQIKRAKYHRLIMQNKTIGADGNGQYFGSMAVDSEVQRLDAIPVSSRKSIFMGAHSF